MVGGEVSVGEVGKLGIMRLRTRSSMDRVSACGAFDNGSIPFGCTRLWRSAGNGNRTLSKSVVLLGRVSSSLTSSAPASLAQWKRLSPNPLNLLLS